MPLKKQFTNSRPMRSIEVLGDGMYRAPRYIGSWAPELLCESPIASEFSVQR
jgi:hypothetical protein